MVVAEGFEKSRKDKKPKTFTNLKKQQIKH